MTDNLLAGGRTIIAEGIGKRYNLNHEYLKYDFLSRNVFRMFRRRSPQDTIWALKDVSFDAVSGEVIGIIGPNGAGKSTLLKILSRITYPTEGRARLGGRVWSLLESGAGFHPELSGRENVYLNGAIMGVKKNRIDAKIGEIADFSEIGRFLDTPVKYYSSGMYVRLAFSLAAHLWTEILLIDEVLAAADAEFQKKCLDRIKKEAAAGRTVLIVSHDMSFIGGFCRRVLLLDKGRLMASGPAKFASAGYVKLPEAPHVYETA